MSRSAVVEQLGDSPRDDLSFDPDFLLRIGEAIRSRRAEVGMTQEALGDQTGLHRSGIGKIERGENAPNVVTLMRIAIALDTKATALLLIAEETDGPANRTWKSRASG